MELYPGVEVVFGEPALYLKSLSILVVTDLHLGFEEACTDYGLFLPRIQFKKLIDRINRLIDLCNPSKIVINGDVKHYFSKLTHQERCEISKLLSFLRDKGLEVYIVRGNHDNYLPLVLYKYDIPLYEYMMLGDILLIHGHELKQDIISRVKLVIIGHEHPSIRVSNELGYTTKLPCFLKVPLKTGQELIVMPALSLYASGTQITIEKGNYLSPIVRELGILEEAVPYVIDGEGSILELPPLSSIRDLIS